MPQYFREFIRVIRGSNVEWEYRDTMQAVAQQLRAEGRQQGMQAGIYQAHRENARKMRLEGLPAETIARNWTQPRGD